MKYIYILLLVIGQSKVFSQNKLDSIRKIGYTIISDYASHPMNTLGLTSKEFYGCIENNPFDYFNRLSAIDTPLEQKIYKTDSIGQYNLLLDSLKRLKSYLKTSFEYFEESYYNTQFSKYNIQNKTFIIYENFTLSEMNSKEYSSFIQKLKSGNLYIGGVLFTSISGIKQTYEVITKTILGQIKRTIYLKTSIIIENEKDALIIEKDRKLELFIAYNGLESISDVYAIQRLLYIQMALYRLTKESIN